MKRKVFAYPYIVWMALFIAVPMVFIFYYAFNVDGSFSFSKAWATLSDISKWRVLWVSIEIAAGTTVFCLLLGYPVAYILSNMRKSIAAFISVLFFVPMWMNFVLRTYAWQAILEYAIPNMLGWTDKTLTGSVWAVMMVLVYNFIPFMVMPLYNSLSKIDRSLIEASGDLGANGRMTFFKVVLPLSVPGIVSGITMVFIPAITAFTVPALIGNGNYNLYGNEIEMAFKQAAGSAGSADYSVGSTLAIILLICVFISTAIMNRFDKDHEEGGQPAVKKVKPFRYVYLALMLLFLYLPIIYLIVFSFNDFSTGRRVSYANLGRWNGFTLENYTNVFAGEAGSALLLTLEIALITSVVATVIGTFAAIGINSMKKRPKSIILNISQLPMVNPDLVTGITFMMLFAFVNGVLANMGADRLSDIVKLLIAHISFSIPYVIFSVMPRLKQSSSMLYEAALDLGCTPMQAMFRVIIPDIMPGITSGFIMALTMSLDDFVVSYFVSDLRSTLSVYMYSAARGSKGVNPALATIIFIPLVTLLLIVNLRRISKEREDEIQNKKVKMKG